MKTKLANAQQGGATARRAFEASLDRLGLDAENAAVFDFSLDDGQIVQMVRLDALDESLKTGWGPAPQR